MVQHHPHRRDGGDGVGEALPHNIESRPVHRLEQRGMLPAGVDVGAGGQAHTAGDHRRNVRQNVGEQVGGHHYIEIFRPAHEIHTGAVDQQRLGFHLRVFRRYFVEYLIPEDHSESLGVGFGDRGHFAALVAADAVFESGADDALGAAPSEDVGLEDRFIRGAGVQPPAYRGVFALGVFAEDDQVDVAGLLAGQRRIDAGIQIGRADADALVEAPAQRQQQPVQRDVIGNVRVAHRPEQDGVKAAQLRQPILRHQPPGLPVIRRPPGKFGEPESRPAGRRKRLQHLAPLGHHLRPHPVPGNHRQIISRHNQPS